MANAAVKRNKFWSCPFFKWDGRAEVSCEAGRPRFPTPKTANEYMNRYCAGDWRACSLAAALLKYYDETEEKPHEKRG